MEAEEIIQALHLTRMPGEGGYYRETYRSSGLLKEEHLGIKHVGDRNHSTAIYYLVTAEHFSALHRLPQDEVFHFYMGDAVEMLQIAPDGAWKKIIMGPQIMAGQVLQTSVPGGHWQGTRLANGGKWALLGTTVA